MNIKSNEGIPKNTRGMLNYILFRIEQGGFKCIDQAKEEAKRFYLENEEYCTQELIKEIKMVNFADKDYRDYFLISEEELSLIRILVFLFTVQLMAWIEYEGEINYVDFGKLERPASPPREAYEDIGYNNMNFLPAKRSYGLLFE
ncbi:hypothetical protein KC929_00155 [Patescibacteria group bacterium]|nr:hypothetical protein [Patescibacteria group bacterium]